ncbi:MAG: glycosyltransferase family 39 protein [Lachnospiraceae bacterium]|nr:glycosyltransferase family 39 protein [Lachnospiraceae bacterium]
MHTTMFHNEKNRIWQILFVLLWCMQMLTAVYFCCQKQGFHEDEYYTYYSTAHTFGLNIEDNAWMEHDTYFNEFTVLRGERFQYGLVKQVQSWDVHPPVYYWVFHTISSVFPEKFSKWYGLSLNLAAYGLSMFLLWILCLKVTGDNEKLSLLICLFYGFTPAVMSSVVFIRMYALLTVFVLLCAILHVRVLEYYDRGDRLPVGKFLFPLALVTYFGFLTQYYYFIFLFFMAVAFCLYLLWKDRNLWNCIRYAVSLAIAFVFAYLTYSAFPGQMFKGQRGAQATGNFFDLSNTFMRLEFFYQLLDEYVFGKMLSLLLIVIIVLLLYVNVKKKISVLNKVDENTENDLNDIVDCESKLNKQKYFILLFTAAGYFFVVSKTALLLGETSIRYQTPIYGIVVLFTFTAIDYLIRRCYRFSGLKLIKHIKFISSNLYNWVLVAAALIAIIVNISGFFAGRVVFLYPEDAERVAFAKEMAANKTPVVYIYDEAQSWCVWDAADELFEYERVYFASQGSGEPITDSAIIESSEVVVYLSNSADPKAQLGRIIESSSGLSEYELMYSEKYCDVYYLRGQD